MPGTHPSYGTQFFHFQICFCQKASTSEVHNPLYGPTPPLQEILDPPLISNYRTAHFQYQTVAWGWNLLFSTWYWYNYTKYKSILRVIYEYGIIVDIGLKGSAESNQIPWSTQVRRLISENNCSNSISFWASQTNFSTFFTAKHKNHKKLKTKRDLLLMEFEWCTGSNPDWGLDHVCPVTLGVMSDH